MAVSVFSGAAIARNAFQLLNRRNKSLTLNNFPFFISSIFFHARHPDARFVRTSAIISIILKENKLIL
jgi:hypothetical protein